MQEAHVAEMKEKYPQHYEHLQKLSSVDEVTIVKDVDRTFPHLGHFEKTEPGYKVLFRILKGLAVHFQDLGYCQGINFLAATLYLIMGDEENTFWVLVHLLQKEDYKAVYSPDLKMFNLACYQLESLVKKHLPKLSYFFVPDTPFIIF